MNADDLYDYVKTIKSRSDFVKFVDCLIVNLRERGAEWENPDLPSFLAGLSGFATDMDGYYKNMGEDVDVESISWKMAAEILFASTVYGN